MPLTVAAAYKTNPRFYARAGVDGLRAQSCATDCARAVGARPAAAELDDFVAGLKAVTPQQKAFIEGQRTHGKSQGLVWHDDLESLYPAIALDGY